MRGDTGCIYDPYRDELFTATKGNGAFLNGLQIGVGDEATIGDATVACGAPPGVLALGPCIRGLVALAPHVRTTRMLGSAGESFRSYVFVSLSDQQVFFVCFCSCLLYYATQLYEQLPVRIFLHQTQLEWVGTVCAAIGCLTGAF